MFGVKTTNRLSTYISIDTRKLNTNGFFLPEALSLSENFIPLYNANLWWKKEYTTQLTLVAKVSVFRY